MLPVFGRGFSIIELMVAMTIGLLMLAGLFYIYINAAQSSRLQGAMALMQTNARYAFELMGVDIRMAGFTGTTYIPDSTNLPDTVVATTDNKCPLVDLFGTKGCTTGGGPLRGYNSSTPGYITGAKANTDSLSVVRTDTLNKYNVSSYNSTTGVFTLDQWYWSTTPSPLPPTGQIFVAADYTHAAVFQVDGSGINSTSKTVTKTGLGSFGGVVSALYNLSGVTYYIGTNPANEPALYRAKLVGNSDMTVTSTAEELVQGVEDMQITYGVDTGTDNNVDAYQDAASGTNWSRVLSVRIALTLVSGQDEKVGVSGDKLIRKTFTNTIAIRNRL